MMAMFSLGIPIAIVENGTILTLTPDSLSVGERVQKSRAWWKNGWSGLNWQRLACGATW